MYGQVHPLLWATTTNTKKKLKNTNRGEEERASALPILRTSDIFAALPLATTLTLGRLPHYLHPREGRRRLPEHPPGGRRPHPYRRARRRRLQFVEIRRPRSRLQRVGVRGGVPGEPGARRPVPESQVGEVGWRRLGVDRIDLGAGEVGCTWGDRDRRREGRVRGR